MPTPAHQAALLTRNSQGDTQIYLTSDSAPASLATTLFGARGLSYDGIAYVLFDPAPLGGQAAPWRKGDILVSRTQSRLGFAGRAILRLRPVALGRSTGYAADIIFSASGDGLQGLALDPHGRLYGGSRQGGKIYRYESDGRGGVRETAWATVPSGMTWNGDIGLSPDGMLFTSTGDGNGVGKLYKFSIGGDPRPFPQIQPIEHRLVFEASGELAGFSFFDNDTVLFTDGRDAYYSRKIDPTLGPTVTPSGQPQFPGIIIPSFAFTEPAIQGLEVIDVAVMRNAWQTYLSQQDVVREQTTWSPEPGHYVAYDDWSNDERCDDLERRLHRMYAWIAAREPAPLAYRFQIDPETGNPRIGPATIPANADDNPQGLPEVVGPRDVDYTVSRDSAVDDYLAHLAHCLWVQVHNLVPWNLHDHPAWGMSSLLGSGSLYKPLGVPEAWYRLNELFVCNARPSDPVEAFDFLTGADPAVRDGDSFVRSTESETIVAFTKWVQGNLTHGYGPNDEQALALYGYSGIAPVSTMYRLILDEDHAADGPRYWTWKGCQTGAGFFVHLMRLLLIPAERLKLYEWKTPEMETYHGGVKFPTAKLASYHVDAFYAVTALQDKNLDPLEIYNGGPYQTYSDYIWRYDVTITNPNQYPLKKDEIQAKEKDYYQEEGRIALRNRTFEMQRLFWEGRIADPDIHYCNRSYSLLKTLLHSIHHLPETEVQGRICRIGEKYERFIDKFMLYHQHELPTNLTDQELLRAGLNLYESLRDWR